MVRFLRAEDALQKIEEIHQNVDPSDKDELELYTTVLEVTSIMLDAYHEANIPAKEMQKDVKEILNIYFEAYETVGFVYKMEA